MDQTWNNARHCAAALKSLLDHLSNQHKSTAKQLPLEKDVLSVPGVSTLHRKHMTDGTIDNPANDLAQHPAKRVKHGTFTEPASSKNHNNDRASTEPQHDASGNFGNDVQFQSVQSTQFDPYNNFPVIDYTGPTFGRAEEQYSQVDDSDFQSLLVASDLYGSFNGGFGNIEWESMANTWGSMQDWGSWGVPDT